MCLHNHVVVCVLPFWHALCLFQGYEGSLIDQTHFETGMLQDEGCVSKETPYWMKPPVSLSSSGYCLHYSISWSSTPSILLLFLCPVFFPSLCFRLVDHDRLTPFVREDLELGGGGAYLKGGKGKSVAPTCLWQSDSMLLVTDGELWWDVRGWEGKQENNFEVSKRVFWQEHWGLGFTSWGAGLEMSSADRCPHQVKSISFMSVYLLLHYTVSLTWRAQ